MAGRKGRSGRRPGSRSWMKSPTALAGYHFSILCEIWLARAPVRRYTVPLPIKRRLAALAIEHVQSLLNSPMPQIVQVLAWARRRAPHGTLRRRRGTRLSPAEQAAENAYAARNEWLANAWKPDRRRGNHFFVADF
jgi:hypothetical protein